MKPTNRTILISIALQLIVGGLPMARAGAGDCPSYLSNWKTNAEETLGELALNELQVPGSHDAGMNTFNFDPRALNSLTRLVRTKGRQLPRQELQPAQLDDDELGGLPEQGFRHRFVRQHFQRLAEWDSELKRAAHLRCLLRDEQRADEGNDQLKKLAEHGGSTSELFLLSWTLTQDKTQAARCSFDQTGITSSIASLAEEANDQLEEVLINQRTHVKIATIFYTDYVDGVSTRISMQANGLLAPCDSNSQCSDTGASGRLTAAESAKLYCCPSAEVYHYSGYDDCTEMPPGSACWSDAMYKSGDCKRNNYRLNRGKCG